MHSNKKGEQMYFGMKAHIGVDAESGLVHTVRGTSGNVSDVTEGKSLLHGEEAVVFGDAGYQGIEKRPDAKAEVTWHAAMRPGKRKSLNKEDEADALIDKAEKIKAGRLRIIRLICLILQVPRNGIWDAFKYMIANDSRLLYHDENLNSSRNP